MHCGAIKMGHLCNSRSRTVEGRDDEKCSGPAVKVCVVAMFVPPPGSVEACTVSRWYVIVAINGAEWLTVRVVESVSCVAYTHFLLPTFFFACSAVQITKISKRKTIILLLLSSTLWLRFCLGLSVRLFARVSVYLRRRLLEESYGWIFHTHFLEEVGLKTRKDRFYFRVKSIRTYSHFLRFI